MSVKVFRKPPGEHCTFDDPNYLYASHDGFFDLIGVLLFIAIELDEDYTGIVTRSTYDIEQALERVDDKSIMGNSLFSEMEPGDKKRCKEVLNIMKEMSERDGGELTLDIG